MNIFIGVYIILCAYSAVAIWWNYDTIDKDNKEPLKGFARIGISISLGLFWPVLVFLSIRQSIKD